MATTTTNILRMPQAEASGASLIGTDIHTGKEVFISRKARSQGVYVIGATGTGKSNLLQQMILSDIQAGLGVCLIEPHADLTNNVLSLIPETRLRDVILLDMQDEEYSFCLSPFECADPTNLHAVAKAASFLMHTFSVLWHIGTDTPQLAQVLRHVTRTCIEAQATFDAIPLLLWDETVREKLLTTVRNVHTRAFWDAYSRKSVRDRDTLIASTVNKLDAWLAEPLIARILCQGRSTLDFRKVMDEGRILLILLSPQLEEASRLVGSLLIGKILLSVFSRADLPEEQRRPWALYADEYSRFMGQDFVSILAEARKFGLLTTIAHQTLEQLDEANKAAATAAGTMVVFRVSGQNAKALAPAYDRTPKPERVGDDPLRAPVSDVVGHLVHKGHHHAVIATFTADFLMPLEGLIRTLGSAMHPVALGAASFRLAHAISARMGLNEALSASQRTGRTDLFIPPLALYMLGAAASQAIPIVFEDHLKSVIFSSGEFQGFRDSAQKLGKPQFLTDQEALERFLTRYAKRRFWDGLFSSRVLTPGPAFVRMLRLLRQVMQILSKEPLLTDTGVYSPRLQQRTYADMEGEIANSLATLPPYQARVRLVSGEHTIRTNPSPQGLTGELFEARLRRIKRQMRFLGYVRDYREVEHEIRERQNKLRGNASADDPPPTHS